GPPRGGAASDSAAAGSRTSSSSSCARGAPRDVVRRRRQGARALLHVAPLLCPRQRLPGAVGLALLHQPRLLRPLRRDEPGARALAVPVLRHAPAAARPGAVAHDAPLRRGTAAGNAGAALDVPAARRRDRRRQVPRLSRRAGRDHPAHAGLPDAPRPLPARRVGAALRRLSRARAARGGVRRVRALSVVAHRQPAGRRRRDVRRAPVLLDHHLERGGGERGRAGRAAAVLALRPLPGLHARRRRHARRQLPRAVRGGVPRLHAARARLPAMAGAPLMRAGRTARGWMQLATEAALILLACGLLQVLAERTNRRIDLTPTRALSLSPVTRNVLAEVTEPLRVTVFHRRGERARFAGLLDRLRTENPHVAYELFDLYRYPERARAEGITQYGRAATEYRGRRVVAPAEPEEQLVGGILQAVRGRRRRPVLTTGHGERVPSGDAQGVGRFVAELDAQGF